MAEQDSTGQHDNRGSKSGCRHALLTWCRSLLYAVILAGMIRWAFIEPFKIPSGSMEPTLMVGDRIFVNKWSYGLRFPLNHTRLPILDKTLHYANHRIWNGRKPQRFDIVVFKTVEDDARHDTLVKRIIGLPEEHVRIANGKVYINGAPLTLPDGMPQVEYTSAPPGFVSDYYRYGILQDSEHSVVPKGHYLVLGDNTSASRDGRVFGWLPEDHLLGRVFAIWWPRCRWRDLTGFSHTIEWYALLTAAAVLVLLRLFVFQSVRITVSTVYGVLRRKEHVVICRLTFGLPLPFTPWRLTRGRPPRHGELVAYWPPKTTSEDLAPDEILVGRVAAMPGQSPSLASGHLRIDGKSLPQDSSLAQTRFASKDMPDDPSTMPDGHYFILADDPSGEADSRTLGSIPARNLIGPLIAVWWPIYRIRKIS